MAIIHFFCDESGKHQKNPIVSISGLGVSRERADAFNGEWRSLLRAYGLCELSMRHAMKIDQTVGTRLVSGQSLEERQQALFPFADCINKYMEIGLVQGWSVLGYAKIPMEAKKLLGGANDPYQLAFIRGLMAIGQYVNPDDHVNVVCDDNLATAWDTYIHYREGLKAAEINERFVGISFAKSLHYTPLQAADMVAFLARREAKEKFYSTPNDCKLLANYLFADQKPPKLMQWYMGFWGEQEMVNLANDIINSKAKSVSEIRQATGSTLKESALGEIKAKLKAEKGSEEGEES